MISLFIFLSVFALSERDIPYKIHDSLHSPTSDFIFSGLSKSADREVLVAGVLLYAIMERKDGISKAKPVVAGGQLRIEKDPPGEVEDRILPFPPVTLLQPFSSPPISQRCIQSTKSPSLSGRQGSGFHAYTF